MTRDETIAEIKKMQAYFYNPGYQHLDIVSKEYLDNYIAQLDPRFFDIIIEMVGDHFITTPESEWTDLDRFHKLLITNFLYEEFTE